MFIPIIIEEVGNLHVGFSLCTKSEYEEFKNNKKMPQTHFPLFFLREFLSKQKPTYLLKDELDISTGLSVMPTDKNMFEDGGERFVTLQKTLEILSDADINYGDFISVYFEYLKNAPNDLDNQ
jgi:hypothetical protein